MDINMDINMDTIKNYPIIMKSFLLAKERDTIYVSFKRENMYYKDSYYILVGDKEKVSLAIKKMYKDVEEEKRDFPRADHNDSLDTPFDTWCDRSCVATCCGSTGCVARGCTTDTIIKCASQWTHLIHNSEEELNNYILNIKAGYYPNFTVEHM